MNAGTLVPNGATTTRALPRPGKWHRKFPWKRPASPSCTSAANVPALTPRDVQPGATRRRTNRNFTTSELLFASLLLMHLVLVSCAATPLRDEFIVRSTAVLVDHVGFFDVDAKCPDSEQMLGGGYPNGVKSHLRRTGPIWLQRACAKGSNSDRS